MYHFKINQLHFGWQRDGDKKQNKDRNLPSTASFHPVSS